jgi:membrane protein DedA with SNARE-associated domain
VTDQLLGWLSLYGLPALFFILVIASAGMPFPVTLLLIAAGSFVAQGEFKLGPVLLLASAGAVVGDQIGYCIGRYGGRRLVRRIAKRIGEERVERAEAFAHHWGGLGIFLSRWLVTPLGPWLNLTSGAAGYSWPRFFLWDVLGEVLWVVLYVLLGKFFNDRVVELADLLGNLTWVIIGVIATIVLGWKLFQTFRNDKPASEEGSLTTPSYVDEQAT